MTPSTRPPANRINSAPGTPPDTAPCTHVRTHVGNQPGDHPQSPPAPSTSAPPGNPQSRPPGIIVGLAAEARLARHWGLPIAIGGGTPQGAAEAANRLAPTVSALISFGLAGGLDPSLPPGTLLVPTTVIDGAQSWPTDPALSHALGGPTPHTLQGGGQILATLAAKQAAFATGAHAVDLESAAVARAAARHNLPFAVLRAICDPAHRPLPHAALAALDTKGRIGPLRVALAALTHPAELPTLAALARDAARARRALLHRVHQTRPRTAHAPANSTTQSKAIIRHDR